MMMIRPVADRVVRLRLCVLASLQCLSQLHHSLQQARRRIDALELQLVEAETARRQLRTRLAGTLASERQARHLALHDPLTQLPNRRRFRERLDLALCQARCQQQGLAVLFLDLDGFKLVNDLYGHGIGDALLQIVAARLGRAVRRQDTMSRLGGDEFACLRLEPALNHEQLARFADKLCETVAAPIHLGALQLSIRPSIGIALYPEDGQSAEQLLRHADAAMYRAKNLRLGHSTARARLPAAGASP
ncbi:MAG: hypothetical protein RJA44_637 [Pseudomonadota bacterium]|jgi:diguanylate cyclase (GGDEF)-like protein